MKTVKRNWTPDEVQEYLPPIMAWTGSKIVNCTLTGRCNPFATVNIQGGGSFEASWQTLARVLSRGISLKM